MLCGNHFIHLWLDPVRLGIHFAIRPSSGAEAVSSIARHERLLLHVEGVVRAVMDHKLQEMAELVEDHERFSSDLLSLFLPLPVANLDIAGARGVALFYSAVPRKASDHHTTIAPVPPESGALIWL